MTNGEFSTATKKTLGTRAHLTCSNPECGKPTAAPDSTVDGTQSIGKAAHIHGRQPGAKRYQADMSNVDRAQVANGIWLCADCHDKVDSDELAYCSELLFEWKKSHEQRVREQFGKPGASLQSKVQMEKLRKFRDASPLAHQIILEQAPGWEYRLTAELLRTDLGEIHSQWLALRDGLLVQNTHIVSADEIFVWLESKMSDMANNAQALSRIVNETLPASWGASGCPGSLNDIRWACALITNVARNMLDFEMSMRFVHVPVFAQSLRVLCLGVAARQIEELLRIPKELSEIFDRDSVIPGVHKIDIILELPVGFSEQIESALSDIAENHFGFSLRAA